MHENKIHYEEILGQILSLCRKLHFTYALEDWLVRACPGFLPEESHPPEDCDVILSLGGDGTLLRSAKIAVEYGKPVLGINVGRVGFLTETELASAEEAFRRLAEGDYTIRERMLLQAEIGGRRELALNDVVVSRGDYSHTIDLDVSADGESLGRYIADGFIVSSPTGSTGYSLSAGGPIVVPGLECAILTPVCAHSLQSKSVVVSPETAVTIRLHDACRYKALVSCDGREPFPLESGQDVVISRAPEKVRFIRFRSLPFFKLVQQKLNFPIE